MPLRSRIMDMKERIQQKAKDLFHRYGIKSITMDEIASQIGASKKTIYQYFSDKDELVDSIIAEMIGAAERRCNQNAESSGDAVDELFQAIDFIQEIFSDMNPVMIYDLERFHPQAYKTFLDYKNKYLYQVIKNNLRKGIEEELFRPDINIDLLAKFRLEAMMIAFNQDVFPFNRFNLAEVHKTIIEHFLFGVASAKGYKLIVKYQQERLKS